MHRYALLLLAAACGRHDAGPPPALACDYHVQIAGDSHKCLEVYDAALVPGQQRWWAKVGGPRDKASCTEHARCPAEGRRGGCLFPNGAVMWHYTDSVAQIQHGCPTGLFVAADEAPPAPPPRTFHCQSDKACRDLTSVVDLGPTIEAKNCQTAGGTFGEGPCPATTVAHTCTVESVDRVEVWHYAVDGPLLATDCTDALHGTWQ